MRVGLAGFGNVGRQVAERLNAGCLEGVRLTAVTARDLQRAARAAGALTPTPAVVPLAELPACCDIIVECATADSFPEIARTALHAGLMLVCVSAGGVPNCPELAELARKHGGRVRIASGAMPGLDIIRSAAEGTIHRVHLASRIRPDSLAHEAYVLAAGHDFSARPPGSPVLVFEGTAGEAAAHFPRHFNVAVALSIAGIGFERTTVEIWADPQLQGTVHSVELDAEEVSLTMTSRNRPSANPRTSRIVAPSIIAALRSLVAPVTAGS